MKNYLHLSIGAPYRLKLLKEIAQKYSKPWREVRYQTYLNQHRGFESNYFESDPSVLPGFRTCTPSDEILTHLKHTGWYTDPYHDFGILRGHVLVTRWGKFAYVIPVTIHSEWDGHSIHLKDAIKIKASEAWDEQGYRSSELESAMREVAMIANRYAEREAKEEREYQIKEIAQETISKLRSEIKGIRSQIRSAISELRNTKLPPTLCELIRSQISSMRGTVQSKLKSIHKWEDNPESYFLGY